MAKDTTKGTIGPALLEALDIADEPKVDDRAARIAAANEAIRRRDRRVQEAVRRFNLGLPPLRDDEEVA